MTDALAAPLAMPPEAPPAAPDAIRPVLLDVSELAEVEAGLRAVPKRLPPKFFYDHRGSHLFEEITRTPEYYPTRAEREILAAWMGELCALAVPHTLVELGAGAAEKTRLILDAMLTARQRAVYVPLDVSAEFLAESAERLRSAYDRVSVRPVVADFTRAFRLPPHLPGPVLVAFLGSTIGNFTAPAAARLLRRVRAQLRPGDRMLIGMDLRKDPAVLEAAYDDAAGITAEFNLNVLHVLNARFGADFDPDAFAHRAVYRRAMTRIEMHLVSSRAQEVTIPGAGVFRIAEGESIRTEISCKYDRPSASALLAEGGFRLEGWRTDREGRFALALAAPFP